MLSRRICNQVGSQRYYTIFDWYARFWFRWIGFGQWWCEVKLCERKIKMSHGITTVMRYLLTTMHMTEVNIEKFWISKTKNSYFFCTMARQRQDCNKKGEWQDVARGSCICTEPWMNIRNSYLRVYIHFKGQQNYQQHRYILQWSWLLWKRIDRLGLCTFPWWSKERKWSQCGYVACFVQFKY